jgi:hypothetical protein
MSKNLEIYSEIDNFGEVERVETALRKFEKVCFYVLRTGDMIVLEPGALHAVLSPVVSAVGGWICYKKEWADFFRGLMNWDLEHTEDKKRRDTIEQKLKETERLYKNLFNINC